jgi:ribonuclease P protein component
MNTLAKIERLSSKRVIETLFKSGDSFFKHPFKVIYCNNELEYNRILISVPKRLFKKAVIRNLIKRRIRESYRNNKSNFVSEKKFDIVFLYISSDVLDYKIIDERIKESLGRIGKVD